MKNTKYSENQTMRSLNTPIQVDKSLVFEIKGVIKNELVLQFK